MLLTKSDILKRLEVIGSQGQNVLNIGEAALLLANLDLPKNSFEKYQDEINLIASDLSTASREAKSLPDRITALSETLYKKHRFQGDVETYDDPQNANLMRVIDRRKGLPVALGILAIHAGRTQGWEIAGLNFPGHFLLRLSKLDEYVLIDPFNEARLVVNEDLRKIFWRIHNQNMPQQSEFVQSVSDRDILVRLQNNIKIRALREGDKERAIKILQSIVLITPTSVEFLAELAMLEASSGHIKSAVERLERFIERNPDISNASSILSLKEQFNRSLN